MEFVNFEAKEENSENYSLNVSDDDEIGTEGNFINDSEEITNDVSFYRSLDHNNVEHYINPRIKLGILLLLFTKTKRCILEKTILSLNFIFLKIEKMLILTILLDLKNLLKNSMIRLEILKIALKTFFRCYSLWHNAYGRQK